MPEKGPKLPSELTVHLESYREQPWVEDITAFGREQGVPISKCDAKLINRDRIRPHFWQDMEEVSRESCDMAFDLFDRYGRVERKYIEPGFRQGSGVGGRELDHGDILLIEKLRVESEARRRGVGTKVAHAVLDHVRGSAGHRKYVAVVGPGIVLQDADETDRDEAMGALATSKLFWRSLGFRRIGTSPWFAFTDQVDHPSRQLDISKEWDPPQHTGAYNAMLEHVRQVITSVLRIRAPNAETLRQLEEALPGNAEDERWFATDEEGNTVLHLAAMNGSLEVVKCITVMEQLRTRKGYLDMLEVVSDRFTGFGPRSITCAGFLSGADVFDLTKFSREEITQMSFATDDEARLIHPEVDTVHQTLRIRYGCTCGECIGGFLSPRMRRMLIEQAAIQRDEDELMPEDDDCMDQGKEILSKPFTECLQKRMIPSEDNILHLVSDEEQPVLEAFLEEGGTVNHQISTIFQRILDSDDWERLLRNDPQVTDLYKELPECRNDLELGFVSGTCGYKRVSPGRPYYHDRLLDEEEEGEEDDDDY
ncbi:hypothetical protein PG991_006366 [Apiospora marii]|uniref:N-acetyltransferase domain-containing protein n=1 Tax=Apiospora marii TaxID=335849 RepID=A0ABR1SD39_9PEZI